MRAALTATQVQQINRLIEAKLFTDAYRYAASNNDATDRMTMTHGPHRSDIE